MTKINVPDFVAPDDAAAMVALALEEAADAMGSYHWNRYAGKHEGGKLSSPAVFTSHTHQTVVEIIRALRPDAFAALERLRAAAKAAQAALERDRCLVIDTVNAIHSEIAGRQWMLEGRGPYEWDDDRYRDEFAAALEVIKAPVEVLRKIGGDWSNCPTDPDEIKQARIDWKARAEAAEARVAELEAERGKVAGQWQPIETAPKDGTRVLAFWPCIMECEDNAACTETWFAMGSWQSSWEREDGYCRPTHWMPRPTPPADLAAKEGPSE